MPAFSSLHPLPAWRLMKAMGRTLGASLRVRGGAPAQATAGIWAARFLKALGIEVELSAPLPVGGQLWACNHLSWIDPLACLSLRPSLCLAKAEVGEYPVVGPIARLAQLRFVRREEALSRAAALVHLAGDLRAGRPALIFPEGTTTRGETLAPLYEGGLRAAYRLGIPLLPLRLSCGDAHYPWTGDESLLPHLVGLSRARRTRILAHPGPLMLPSHFQDESHWMRAIAAHLAPHAHDSRGCA